MSDSASSLSSRKQFSSTLPSLSSLLAPTISTQQLPTSMRVVPISSSSILSSPFTAPKSQVVSHDTTLPESPSETIRIILNDPMRLKNVSLSETIKTMGMPTEFTQYVTSPIPGKKKVLMFFRADSSHLTAGKLYWCEASKKFDPDTLSLSSITELFLGKHARVFREIGADAVDERCFSLIAAEKILHFEASSPTLLSLWLFGMCTLMSQRGLGITEEPVLYGKKRKSLEEGDAKGAINTPTKVRRILVSSRTVLQQGASQTITFHPRKRDGKEPLATTTTLAPPPPPTTDISTLLAIVEDKKLQLAAAEKKNLEHEAVIAGLREELNKLKAGGGPVNKEVLRKEKLMQLTKVLTPVRELKQDFKSLRAAIQAHLKRERDEVIKSLKHLEQSTSEYDKERNAFQSLLSREQKKRKQLLNRIIEIQGNIRVFCRVRPLNARELESEQNVAKFPGDDALDLMTESGEKRFEFDRVFDPSFDQADVFRETAPFVQSCVDGYRVCIFAYGQTGSGKTYTMEGPYGDKGVNYRALEELFSLISNKSQTERTYEVTVSVVEIYNEQAHDLLATDKSKVQRNLEVRQGPQGVYIPDLTEVKVFSEEEVRDLMQNTAYPNRAVEATSMNEHSSRSHCMLFVNVTGTEIATGAKTLGKLVLIDLAGSERVKRSEATGQRLKEAQHINKSLSALGDVISALQAKAQHIPFRNSKLTYLLQDSLGGSAKCLMFCCISSASASVQETLCSLQFATRARNVQLGAAKKNVKVGDNSQEIKKYKEMAEKAIEEKNGTKDKVAKLEKRCITLEEEKRLMEEKLHLKEKELAALQNKLREGRTSSVGATPAVVSDAPKERRPSLAPLSTHESQTTTQVADQLNPLQTLPSDLRSVMKKSKTKPIIKQQKKEGDTSTEEEPTKSLSFGGVSVFPTDTHLEEGDEEEEQQEEVQQHIADGVGVEGEEEETGANHEEEVTTMDAADSPIKKMKAETSDESATTATVALPTRLQSLEQWRSTRKAVKTNAKVKKVIKGGAVNVIPTISASTVKKGQENREPNINLEALNIEGMDKNKQRRGIQDKMTSAAAQRQLRVTRSATKSRQSLSRPGLILDEIKSGATRGALPTKNLRPRQAPATVAPVKSRPSDGGKEKQLKVVGTATKKKPAISKTPGKF